MTADIYHHIQQQKEKADKHGIITVCLKDSQNFVRITNGENYYYGGNQAWYEWGNKKKNFISRNGACGTIAAANITAYLASHHTKYTSLYSYSDYMQSNFILHMKELYQYIAPYHIGEKPLGVWPISRLADGIEAFSRDRNVKLKAVWKNKKFNFNNIIEYIAEGLERDLPVAMLIGTNGFYPAAVHYFDKRSSSEKLWMHWVTITELNIDKDSHIAKVKVSTWGGWAELNLNHFLKEFFYGGLLYFM